MVSMTIFTKDGDLAWTLVAVSKIDNILTDCIKTRLAPSFTTVDKLLGTDRSASTLPSKIELAYRLGLIDKDFSDSLHTIRKIRNTFAHSDKEMHFADKPIADRLSSLYVSFHGTKVQEAIEEIVDGNSSISDLQKYFITAVVQMSSRLLALKTACTPIDFSKPMRLRDQ